MTGQRKDMALADRIFDKCKIAHGPLGTRCWLWTGYSANGYGKLRWEGKRLFVHRAMYEVAIGPIVDGLCVCHKCDNPLCVNPNHLFLGTRADNNADKVEKDRQSRGEAHAMPKESHPMVKLTQQQVDEIRASKGITQRRLADQYGVSQSAISHIKRNARWKD